MARFNYWDVKLPEDGAPYETREQVWAALKRFLSSLGAFLANARVNAWSGEVEDGSPLGASESLALRNEIRRLEHVADQLGKDVVELLASVSPSREDKAGKLDPEVARFLQQPYSDLDSWLRTNRERMPALLLALADKHKYEFDRIDHLRVIAAQLRDADYDDDEIRGVLERLADADRRDPCIYECPRCDRDGSFPRADNRYQFDTCTRCDGVGYVFQKKRPSEVEYGMSREGKLALNAGKLWTRADEERVLLGSDDPEGVKQTLDSYWPKEATP